MSRADFERGWQCAVAEVARKLRDAKTWSAASAKIDGTLSRLGVAGLLPLLAEEAACHAENVTPNIGAQRSEVGVTTLVTLASPVGCRPVSATEAKLFARMRSGGQVAETCGVFRLTERGRAELL